MTKKESFLSFKDEKVLRKTLFLSQFIAVCSLDKNALEAIDKSEYKKKIIAFSENIDNWHKTHENNNLGEFNNDDEFMELVSSPTKFD